MTIGTSVIMQDPPFSPGSPLPFNISEVPLDVQEVQLHNLDNLYSMIEIGAKVSQGIKQRLQNIHAHHNRVLSS